VITVKQGVEIDGDDGTSVQRPESREVVRHVQEGLLAPSTAVVPTAFRTSSQLSIQVGSLRLVQGRLGPESGVVVLDVSFRSWGSVDRDIVVSDRVVLPSVGRGNRNGSVDTPPFELSLKWYRSVHVNGSFEFLGRSTYVEERKRSFQDGCVTGNLYV